MFFYLLRVLEKKNNLLNNKPKVLTLITAPVSIIIQNQLDATFLFVAFAINICSFLTLALIFIPKVKVFPIDYFFLKA